MMVFGLVVFSPVGRFMFLLFYFLDFVGSYNAVCFDRKVISPFDVAELGFDSHCLRYHV